MSSRSLSLVGTLHLPTDTQRQLGLDNGALIAVPIPEEYETDGAVTQRAIEQAIAESEENGISKRGKEATPWLLSRISELTKGDSLTANVALLKNTALVGKSGNLFHNEKCLSYIQVGRLL